MPTYVRVREPARLADAVDASGLTKVHIAQVVGISRNALHLLRSGEQHRLEAAKANTLAELLRQKPTELFELEDAAEVRAFVPCETDHEGEAPR